MKARKTFVLQLAAILVAVTGGVQQAHAGDRFEMGPKRGGEAQPARAPEAQRATAATEAPGATWYGWQTFLADAASAGLMIGGLAMKNGGIAFVGGIGYVAGAPTIHAVHGSETRMGVSVALRLLLPVIGYAIADGQSTCEDPAEDPCELAGVLGGMAGMAVAVPIDWFAVSWEVPKAPVSVTPWVASSGNGGTIGLMGAF